MEIKPTKRELHVINDALELVDKGVNVSELLVAQRTALVLLRLRLKVPKKDAHRVELRELRLNQI